MPPGNRSACPPGLSSRCCSAHSGGENRVVWSNRTPPLPLSPHCSHSERVLAKVDSSWVRYAPLKESEQVQLHHQKLFLGVNVRVFPTLHHDLHLPHAHHMILMLSKRCCKEVNCVILSCTIVCKCTDSTKTPKNYYMATLYSSPATRRQVSVTSFRR